MSYKRKAQTAKRKEKRESRRRDLFKLKLPFRVRHDTPSDGQTDAGLGGSG